MFRDYLESAAQQCFAGFHTMPGRRAGWMGQGNEIKFKAVAVDGKFSADDFVEFFERHELLDGQAPDGDDQFGLENFEFCAQPTGTVLHFVGCGNTVAARGALPGKTAADGGHVNGGAEFCFGHSGGFMEPAKESFASGPGKGTAQDGFAVAGRLADKENFADNRAAADDRRVHLGAGAAGAELVDVGSEQAGE